MKAKKWKICGRSIKDGNCVEGGAMKKDPRRLDIALSIYQRTTEIFSEFSRPIDVVTTPFCVKYMYDTLYLKDFMTLTLKANGDTSNYNVGFLVRHCGFWDKASQIKRKEITRGILMSDLKKRYYNKVFYGSSEDSILGDIYAAILKYVKAGNNVNEDVINFAGFELYAQSGFLHNNPGGGIEYGETDVYLVSEIVVEKVGLVWD